MLARIREFSKRIANNPIASYFTAIVVGCFIFLVFMFYYQWDLIAFISSNTMFVMTAISGTVIRFLSGLGITLTYAALCQFIFTRSSGFVKGKKKRVRILKLFVLLPILVIVAYAAYKFANAALYSNPLTILELLLAIGGVWSLMIMVYAIPASRSEYKPEFEDDKTDEIKSKLEEFKDSIWKGYQSKVHKEYGKVQAKEFEKYHRKIDEIRQRLSAILILPLSLILLVFPPLTGIGIILWIRSFSLDDKALAKVENFLLIIVVVGVIVVSSIMFLFVDVAALVIFFDSAYAVGMVLSITVLGIMIVRT
jgi:hypothetical protein